MQMKMLENPCPNCGKVTGVYTNLIVTGTVDHIILPGGGKTTNFGPMKERNISNTVRCTHCRKKRNDVSYADFVRAYEGEE